MATPTPQNARILPQTKFCNLCSAKFTRTTHLNRHIRSHNNVRKFECDICDSKFTRSDLLARHKRSCGSPNAAGSRRKSCQECARSKIKCDLQEPCSKCADRGRPCIYVNDPQISLAKLRARSSSLSDDCSPVLPSPVSPTLPPFDESAPASMHLSAFNTSVDAIATQSLPHLVIDNWQPAWLPTDMSASDTSSNYSGTDVPPSTPVHASLSPTHADPFASQFAAFSNQDMSINAPPLSHDELHALLGCPFAGACYHAPGACLCHSLPQQPAPPSSSVNYQAMHDQYTAPVAPSSLMAMSASHCGPALSHNNGMSFNDFLFPPMSQHTSYDTTHQTNTYNEYMSTMGAEYTPQNMPFVPNTSAHGRNL